MATPKKRAILYLHVDFQTKKALKALCKKQIGRVSQSRMAEELLIAALKLGVYNRGTKGGKYGKSKVQNRHVR